MTTARPWPENARPTPSQLLEWLRQPGSVVHADEALTVLDRLLEAADRADRCLIADHDGTLTRYNQAVTTLITESNRYRLAWINARNRAADPNHAADVLEALALTTLEEDPDDR